MDSNSDRDLDALMFLNETCGNRSSGVETLGGRDSKVGNVLAVRLASSKPYKKL